MMKSVIGCAISVLLVVLLLPLSVSAAGIKANCSYSPEVRYGSRWDVFVQIAITAKVTHSEYAKYINFQVRDVQGNIMAGANANIHAYPGEVGSAQHAIAVKPHYPEEATAAQKKIILDKFSKEYIARLSKATCEAIAFSR